MLLVWMAFLEYLVRSVDPDRSEPKVRKDRAVTLVTLVFLVNAA